MNLIAGKMRENASRINAPFSETLRGGQNAFSPRLLLETRS
jgi:hypothetical protein